MTIAHFFSIPLQTDFQQLYVQLHPYFGFVFLQDDDQPVLAMLPKSLWQPEQQIQYIRQEDLSYQKIVQTQDVDFLPTHTTTSSYQGFTGGYIAFFSYDYAAQQHIPLRHVQQPSAIVAEYDIFIRHIQGKWQLYVADELRQSPDIQALIDTLQKNHTPQYPTSFTLQHPMQARWTKAEYADAFQRVQAYLHAGDCYQVNLTQQFYAEIAQGRLSALLPELLTLSQAPYAAYWAIDDFELLSCSPELFIEFQDQRVLRTRPIKGTLPRHPDAQEDRKQKAKLAQSDKDKAENVMIVDLLRNDLSLYAEIGSVKVPHLFEIESFAQVHHMVSEIQATLKPDVDVLNVLNAALPGGSITGAPKIRAMQIIDELEGHARGAYCGSLGYINYDGTGRFNILIRTLQRYGNQVNIWAGGGITVASQLDAEYQESLDKVAALLAVLNQYAKI